MNCTQVRLTNTLLYITPDGPLYVNNTQLAYYKLLPLQSLPYDELQSIIASSQAPDGLWFAYYRNRSLHVIHQAVNGHTSIAYDGFSTFTDNDLYAVYPSMDDVINDFPEYFI